jgi:hypothetical protein
VNSSELPESSEAFRLDKQTGNLPQPTKFDLSICVLWSQLGSRLHPGRHRWPDSTAYTAGTEHEFETALEGFRTNKRPDALRYRRDEIPLFPVSELQPERKDGVFRHSSLTLRPGSNNLLSLHT